MVKKPFPKDLREERAGLKIPTPKDLRTIIKRLTPEQRRLIHEQISVVFGKGRLSRFKLICGGRPSMLR
jgi:hypothetical protein